MKSIALFFAFAFCAITLFATPAYAQRGFLGIAPATTPEDVPKPANLVLTWEAQTSVPNWYEGRALPIAGSMVKVNLMLLDENGKKMPSDKYKIRWHTNYTPELSAQDKTQLNLKIPDYFYGEMLVKVALFSLNGSVADARVSIPVTRPKLSLSIPYPLRIAKIEETILQAIPFFFPNQEAENLSYSWQVANISIPNQDTFGGFAIVRFSEKGFNIPVSVTTNVPANSNLRAGAQSFISVK
jgi:hypothetical protein